MKKILLILILSALVIVISPVGAIVVNVAPSQDTYVYEQTPTTNYGNETTMYVKGHPPYREYSYIQFDLSLIPSGSIINYAILELYDACGGYDSTTVDAIEVTSNWVEGELTWNSIPTNSASILSSFTRGGSCIWESWDITELTKSWYNGTKTNNGVVLIETSMSAATINYYTKEYDTDTSKRPYLAVNYSPPAYIPPTPVIGTVTTGDFWVNMTWKHTNSIIDSYSETDYSSDKFIYNDSKVGQALHITDATSVSRAKFYLGKNNFNVGTATVNIYAATGTVGVNATGIGGALATSNPFDVSILPLYGYQLITFNFSTPYSLLANTDYVFAVEYYGDYYLKIGVDQFGTHPGNECNYDSGIWGYHHFMYNDAYDTVFYIMSGDVTDNITDSYNVSMNDVWANGSNATFINSTLSAHAWQNVSVYAFNKTKDGTLSTTALMRNTQIPNNVPVIATNSLVPATAYTTSTLISTVASNDADEDTIAYTYQWYENGSSIVGATSSTLSPPLTIGATYNVFVTPNDGYGSGIGTYSNSVTIQSQAPPASVKNLMNVSYASAYINWTWTDPDDLDFDKVMIYLNGTFQRNVTNGTQYYNATDLIPNTMYEIGTRTVGVAGNINTTWVNHSARTSSAVSRIITVDDGGGANYSRIQGAVDAASAGDIILVYSGTYFETVVVNKQLELIGQDNSAGMPIVNAVGMGDVITITADRVILNGFYAKNCGPYCKGILA